MKSMRDTKKMFENKIVRLNKIYKITFNYFFIRVIPFHLFIKNVFMKIKNSIFPPKYMTYRRNVRKQNYLF